MAARNLNPIHSVAVACKAGAKPLKLPFWASTTTRASFRKNDISLIARKNSRNPRRLVTIPTSSDGRWHGKWTCDYLFSLQELQLQDLAEDEAQRDAQVSVTLSIQKHAGFGLSVDGKVTTSFTRKCCCCSSPFCREINANFNVWVLPSGRHSGTTQLPETGGDDQVIYVKPGYEADLDSLVQDTVRLATSVKETCSDSCEKSQPRMQYLGEQKAASIDRRWSRLLELRNAC